MENLSVFSHVASASGNLFAGVARPAHFVCGLRAVAQLAQCALVERSFPFVFSSQL